MINFQANLFILSDTVLFFEYHIEFIILSHVQSLAINGSKQFY